MNRCVTVIFIETGKCLDVEVLSKVCQGYQLKEETKEDSQEKRLWQADHQGRCKANYKKSAPAILGGKGKLTDAMIDRLQNYYGITIRSNVGDLAQMKKKAIHASLFHCASSEQRNLHLHCPEGPNSWCRFNKDRANQTNIYKPGPGLPLNVIAELKPVYKRLSEDDILASKVFGWEDPKSK